MDKDLMKAASDAAAIWNGGACNPRAIARALVNAIDAGTKATYGEQQLAPARLILAQLCFLLKAPMDAAGGYGEGKDVMEDLKIVEAINGETAADV